jgi:serine phosphatase RsbU (regulator of sigma subunit)
MLNLKSIYAKMRVQLIAVLTVILAIIGLINFYFIFNVTAQSNDECTWASKKIGRDSSQTKEWNPNDSTALFFSLVKKYGVTWNAGIRDGDELISIDGIKAKNALIMTQVLDRVNSGDYATYLVKRSNTTFETKVEVKKLIDFSGLAFSLLSFIWLVVGYIILMAKPDGKTQKAFYRIGAIAILYSTSSLLYRSGVVVSNPVNESATLIFVIYSIWTLGAAFFPFIYIHFFLLFPSKYKIVSYKRFKLVWYLIPAVIYVLCMVYLSLLLTNTISSFASKYFSYYFKYSVFASIIIGTVLLFINYSRLKSKEERNAIFVIVVSCLIGLVILVYTLTLQNTLADNLFNTPQYFMPIIFLAVIPIGFGYSLFRYSLMDMSDVLKNSILYIMATISLAVIYFFLIYVIGQWISSVIGTEYQGIIAGVVFVIFALIFQSTKDKFQKIITKRFYPEQFAYQKVLLKFSTDVTSTVGLDNILDSTLNTFVEQMKLQHFGIMLAVENSNSFELIRSEGFFNGSLSFSVDEAKLDNFLDNKTIYKNPAAVERAEFEMAFSKEAVDQLVDERIYTVIPLRRKSKIIGFTLFGLKLSGSQFSGKDLELLVATANQTAVSIENALLYKMEAHRLSLERDLENARVIQESLLPHVIPQFKNIDIAGKMVPAMVVGGDYYDIIKVSDTQFFIVIGDVSGKGLSASFYMSKLQTMMQLFCIENRSPKEILIETNKRISESIEKGWFVTVSLALFNLASGKIKFCRAGHTPLVYIKDNRISLIQPRGIGVGLEKGDIFEQNLEELELTITGNELFFFYSDGVNEAENEHKEFFGENRFEDLLISLNGKSSKEVLEDIFTEIKKFRGRASQNDDITMTLVKVN